MSELKVAVSLPMLCYDTAFNVSAVFMRFCDTCVRMCVCVYVWERACMRVY